MSSRPFISICIPTYNRPSYLRTCLESIVSQETFDTDIEILIFDDASKDNLEPIITTFKEKVPSLRYVKNEVNVRADRNIFNLLTHFEGEYFFGMTDDDTLLPGALKNLRKMIAEHPRADIILCASAVLAEGKDTVTTYQLLPQAGEYSHEQMRAIVTLFNSTHIYSQICMKRSAIDAPGYERHIGSMYPHLHTTGSALLKGVSYYSDVPLVKHISGNIVSWKYPDDYMLKGKIAIIKDLARIDPSFYKPALKPLIENIPNIVIQSLSVSKKKFLRFLFALIQIPELRWRLSVWTYISIPLLRIVKFKVRTALQHIVS